MRLQLKIYSEIDRDKMQAETIYAMSDHYTAFYDYESKFWHDVIYYRKKGVKVTTDCESCVIPFKLPSLNEYVNECRANRYQASAFKKKIQADIKMFLLLIPINMGVVIDFEWHEQTARRDLDNIAFAKKFILDAMVEKGILPNDNQQYVKGFTDSFSRDGDYVRVRIRNAKKDYRQESDIL